MIHSMTGFATQQIQGDWGTAVCEIRSLNQRYLETHIRLPELLKDLEIPLRDHLRQQVHRGKVEYSLRFQSGVAVASNAVVNEGLVRGLIDGAKQIASLINKPLELSVNELIRWPGVLELTTQSLEHVKTAILTMSYATIAELLVVRQREGQMLLQFLTARLDSVRNEVAKIKSYQQATLPAYRDKIINRINELKITGDLEHFEKEVVLSIQKNDIAEEIDRLDMHVIEAQKILKRGGVAGKHLDFLMQELNREANTIAAKAFDVRISQAAIELKILIEQMREQIQNIE